MALSLFVCTAVTGFADTNKVYSFPFFSRYIVTYQSGSSWPVFTSVAVSDSHRDPFQSFTLSNFPSSSGFMVRLSGSDYSFGSSYKYNYSWDGYTPGSYTGYVVLFSDSVIPSLSGINISFDSGSLPGNQGVLNFLTSYDYILSSSKKMAFIRFTYDLPLDSDFSSSTLFFHFYFPSAVSFSDISFSPSYFPDDSLFQKYPTSNKTWEDYFYDDYNSTSINASHYHNLAIAWSQYKALDESLGNKFNSLRNDFSLFSSQFFSSFSGLTSYFISHTDTIVSIINENTNKLIANDNTNTNKLITNDNANTKKITDNATSNANRIITDADSNHKKLTDLLKDHWSKNDATMEEAVPDDFGQSQSQAQSQLDDYEKKEQQVFDNLDTSLDAINFDQYKLSSPSIVSSMSFINKYVTRGFDKLGDYKIILFLPMVVGLGLSVIGRMGAMMSRVNTSNRPQSRSRKGGP